MPAGKHTSVRVALAVPPKIHEQLSEWADYEGRPLASLCMYLIEKALRDAQREGIAPKYGESEEPTSVVVKEVMRHNKATRPELNDEQFIEYYEEQYGDLTKMEEPSPADMERMVSINARNNPDTVKEIKSKKEALLEKLISVLSD
ncbi:hypothetical protein N8654_03215 [Synechococcus sp. AH-601-B19]|nr:hypothetical protein [Synechococcus sp. AH-601-B19]